MYKPQAVAAGEKTCWRFTNEQVEHSPSRLDGMSWEDEQRLRLAGCAHILETVRLVLEYSNRAIAPAMRTSPRVTERRMRLPCSTACVLFNRFFTRQSFARHDRFVRGLRAPRTARAPPTRNAGPLFCLALSTSPAAAHARTLKPSLPPPPPS